MAYSNEKTTATKGGRSSTKQSSLEQVSLATSDTQEELSTIYQNQ